jgi:S1-C subfamily serine protease
LTVGSGVAARDLVTGLSLDKAGSDANKALAGNIGEGFLHRFNLIFDYSRQRIIFEKNGHYNDPDIENRGGLTLDAADGSGLVVAVVPSGPAAQAGIKVGDTILSLNGQRMTAFAFSGARHVFQQPVGTRVRVRLLSDNHLRIVTIVLRDLV